MNSQAQVEVLPKETKSMKGIQMIYRIQQGHQRTNQVVSLAKSDKWKREYSSFIQL